MPRLTKVFDQTPYALHVAGCGLLVFYGLFISSVSAMSIQSADLYATWVAAEFMEMGRVDQVYPPAGAMFDMTTPSDWWAHVAQTNDRARIFPYLYPPVWVWLVSHLTPVLTFETFDMIFLVIHQAALFGSIVLATRLCDLSGKPQLAVIGVTYTALTLTLPMALGLAENQPQILVSFLIVFAFERAHFGRMRTAGALLALAAAIKLYPVLFVVIFLGRRQWSALGSFAVVGGALGLMSIVLVGWALHADYLELIKTLGRSVVLTNFSLSIDAYLAATVFANDLTPVHHARNIDPTASWAALAKTPAWVMASLMANVAALAAVMWLAARSRRDALVLPFAATVLALLSPLSWAYTYMTAFVFLGALPRRLGVLGYAIVALATLFFHRAVPRTIFGKLDVGVTGGWAIAICFMVLFAVAFGLGISRRTPSRRASAAPAPPAPILPMPNPA